MNDLYPKALIIQFAKAPVAGEVKTRMQPHLDPEQCAELQRRLVSHTFHTLKNARVAAVELWVGGEDPEGFFIDLCKRRGASGAAIIGQRGGDLGERMHHAFEKTLARASPVILVGSDCPFFTENYLREAIELLVQGNQDVVLGPAEDGGYVMIGLRRPSPLVFRNIDWGTDQVLNQTRERLTQLGWHWREMPMLADIDEPEDLVKLERLGVI